VRVTTWGVLNHNLNCVIKFLVVTVQVNNFVPELIFSANSDQFTDIQFLEESLDEIEKFFLFVLSVKAGKGSEDSNMGLSVGNSLLQKLNYFIAFFVKLIESYHFLKMIWNQNNLNSCGLSKFKFFNFNTRKNDFFPGFYVISFLSVFDRLLVLSKVHKTTCDFRIAFQFREKNLSGFEVSFVIKTISSSGQICGISLFDESLQFL